jgi:hypothetical protein
VWSIKCGVTFLPAVIALIIVLELGWNDSAQAKEWKSKKSSPSPSAASTSDHIIAIHLTSITINLFATHAAKEYKVTPATKITVNGQTGQLNGLATGMDVVVTPAPDGVTAASINAKTRR